MLTIFYVKRTTRSCACNAKPSSTSKDWILKKREKHYEIITITYIFLRFRAGVFRVCDVCLLLHCRHLLVLPIVVITFNYLGPWNKAWWTWKTWKRLIRDIPWPLRSHRWIQQPAWRPSLLYRIHCSCIRRATPCSWWSPTWPGS